MLLASTVYLHVAITLRWLWRRWWRRRRRRLLALLLPLRRRLLRLLLLLLLLPRRLPRARGLLAGRLAIAFVSVDNAQAPVPQLV